MRVSLIVPPSSERFNAIPDLGLAYLAACARQAGHKVDLQDCLLEKYDIDDFAAYVEKHQPDLLGIKVYSCDIDLVAQMLEVARRVSPETITVLGGPHPSYEVAERLVKQFPGMDYAFAGEGEPGFAAFLTVIESGEKEALGDIPGLIWKGGDGAVHANPRTFVHDLDSLPFPAWDLVDPRRYKFGYSFMTTELPSAPMVLTRGCPFQCTFCGSYLITGRKVRKRSVDNVIEEMKLLQGDYGVRSIDVVDENLAFDRDFVIALCERLMRESLGIVWNCPYGVRLTSLDEETVRLMDRAGCFGLSVGIESGSDRVLKSIKKGLKVEQVVEKVQMIKRVSKIALQGYFMMGFPGETREDIEKTIDLACSLPFDLVTFCPLRVTPGTEIYNNLVSEGKVPADLDYNGLGHHHFVRSYCEVPDVEMRKLYRKAYARFYFRPKVVLNLLSRVCTRAQIRTILNGLRRMVYTPKSRNNRRRGSCIGET